MRTVTFTLVGLACAVAGVAAGAVLLTLLQAGFGTLS